MPRYFFNLRRGQGPDELTIDHEGDELADRTQVRPHALEVARKVMRTRSHVIRDWMVCSFEVVDEHGVLIAVVPFSDTDPDQG